MFWMYAFQITAFPSSLKLGAEAVIQTRNIAIGLSLFQSLALVVVVTQHVTVDNFFTDITHNAHLLDNNMTLIGTVKSKQFLPQELKTGQIKY